MSAQVTHRDSCKGSCNKAVYAGQASHSRRLSYAWLPLGVSCVLFPFLMLAGGPALGAYGTGNEALDTFVSIAWFLIPLGGIISIFCTPIMFAKAYTAGNKKKMWEAVGLLLSCIFLFPVYVVFCMMVYTGILNG